MNRNGHKDAVFFIGPEVEHTPAFSKKTLFVIGKPRVEQIFRMANEYKTPHVFMGANHSFSVDPTDGTLYWDNTITALLDKGFWVTLDYPAHQHQSVLMILNAGVWHSRLFIPLLSVRIPKIETSSVNLTVKIDDVDFAATNPGVWTMHFSEVTDSNRFTGWNEYESDDVVEPMAGAAEILPLKIPVPPTPVVNTSSLPKTVSVQPEITDNKVVEMNPQDLGLDPDAGSMLKPDLNEIVDKFQSTPLDALVAYTEGTKSDPLSEAESTKPVKKVTKK